MQSASPALQEASEAERMAIIVICRAFLMYPKSAMARLQFFSDQVPAWLEKALPSLSTRFANCEAAVKINAVFLRTILEDMKYIAPNAVVASDAEPDQEEDGWVTGLLTQLRREWSDEGAEEREQSIGVTLEALRRFVPIQGARSKPRVILPGAGLGRHVWELAHAGYDALGIERALMMVVVGRYILDRLIPRGQSMPYCPHIHEFYGPTNVEKAEHLHRQVRIPGAATLKQAQASQQTVGNVPRPGTAPGSGMRVRSGDFSELADDAAYALSWDAVITCFYLDACGDVYNAIDTTRKLRAKAP